MKRISWGKDLPEFGTLYFNNTTHYLTRARPGWWTWPCEGIFFAAFVLGVADDTWGLAIWLRAEVAIAEW
jgi:hypothetical protein